jgi:hypothetical protein
MSLPNLKLPGDSAYRSAIEVATTVALSAPAPLSQGPVGPTSHEGIAIDSRMHIAFPGRGVSLGVEYGRDAPAERGRVRPAEKRRRIPAGALPERDVEVQHCVGWRGIRIIPEDPFNIATVQPIRNARLSIEPSSPSRPFSHRVRGSAGVEFP